MSDLLSPQFLKTPPHLLIVNEHQIFSILQHLVTLIKTEFGLPATLIFTILTFLFSWLSLLVPTQEERSSFPDQVPYNLLQNVRIFGISNIECVLFFLQPRSAAP